MDIDSLRGNIDHFRVFIDGFINTVLLFIDTGKRKVHCGILRIDLDSAFQYLDCIV